MGCLDLGSNMVENALELDGLRAFLAVVEKGGFTAAAEVVGRSQSAVSLKIKKLEDLIGKPLFVRNAHKTILTTTGELLLSYARRLVDDSETALAHLRAPDAVGAIKLGLGELFVPDHLPWVLSRFKCAYPKVKLEVRVGLSADMLQDLRAGALDLVVTNREGDERTGRVIWTEPLLWVSAKDFDIPASGPVPLVTLPPQCIYRRMALESLQSIGRTGDVVYACSSLAGVEAALAVGAGIAIMGQSVLRRNPALKDIGQSLPTLPACEIAAFGPHDDGETARGMLLNFIQDSLKAVSQK